MVQALSVLCKKIPTRLAGTSIWRHMTICVITNICGGTYTVHRISEISCKGCRGTGLEDSLKMSNLPVCVHTCGDLCSSGLIGGVPPAIPEHPII